MSAADQGATRDAMRLLGAALILAAVLVCASASRADAAPNATSAPKPHASSSPRPSPSALPNVLSCDESCYPPGATKRKSWASYLDAYNAAKIEYTKAYWDAQGRLTLANVAPYEKQRATDPYILVVVVVIVLTGLVLSVLQFLKGPLYARTLATPERIDGNKDQPGSGRHRARNKEREDDDEVDDATMSDLKLSLNGIELRSASIGLLVLTLSIAFFYLYLIYVYQIHATK